MEKVFINKTEKLHRSTTILWIMFNSAVLLMFANLGRLNSLVILNIIILIILSMGISVLFENNHIKVRTFRNLNYFFLIPALAGTILQIAL